MNAILRTCFVTLVLAAGIACSDSTAPLEEDGAAILVWGRSDTTMSVQLRRVEYGGAPAEVLLNETPGYAIGPFWPSPDGRSTLYTRRTNLGGLQSTMNLAFGESPTAINEPGTPISWSPNGGHIMWRGIFWEVIVTDQNGVVLDTTSLYDHPAWAPDGQSIYATHYDSLSYPQIARFPLYSDSAVFLTRDGGYNYNPYPSPDGRLIAFTSYRDHPMGPLDLFLMQTDGSDVRRIYGNCCYGDTVLAWSPNSRLLAVLRRFEWTGDDHDELLVLNTQGSTLSRSRFPLRALLSFAWGPTKNVLMFVTRTDDGTGPFQVFLMQPDGTGRRQVTFDPLGVAGAVWAPR